MARDTKTATTILVIEDEQFLRNLISEKLRHEGYMVASAIDGEEGLRMASEEPPALILLDLLLPGIDGFEVLRRLKAEKKTSGLPVLVLSNLGQREDIDRAMSLGANGFLIKANFTPGQVAEKIQETLSASYF